MALNRSWIWFSVSLLTAGACGQSDPLSAISNSAGTAILRDTLVGQNSRAICVTTTLNEECSSRTSEVFIEDVSDLTDVKAKWIGDDAVSISFYSGRLSRFSNVSRDGSIGIRIEAEKASTPKGPVATGN